MALPKKGERYRLKTNFGNEDQGLHMIGGSVGTVDAVVAKGEGEPPHPTGGVVIEFEAEPNRGIPSPRHWGISLDEFTQYFEEAPVTE